MDPAKNLNGILKVIPSFGFKKTDMSQLSSKDKRYVQQVEKALASFDSLEEWADYIAFLSRLQKSLQLSDDNNAAHTLPGIVYSHQVANKLSLCLSSRLPNGVHQKALSLYEDIFRALTSKALNDELSIWIPGLLPVLSFCSLQIKPQLLKLYKEYLLANISPSNLRIVSKPLILSLLPGLDDENSELFSDVLDLMDLLKKKLNNDAHFWQSMFLSIISNPEKRLGALCWCNKRLPVFQSIVSEDKTTRFSDEAQACLTPDSGLLIRAFAASINSTTNFNPASDIIVIRGFFDLLLTHLPLNSKVLHKIIFNKDKEMLMMACCRVTLRKDMSLNRRLWNWLLGPENEHHNIDTPNELSRAKYFQEYGLQSLTSGLLKIIEGSKYDSDQKVDALRISLSLIMDKWEICHTITDKLFLPIMETCFQEYNLQQNKNESHILSSSQTFFDGVEASYIWKNLISMILDGHNDKLDLIYFVLNNFDFNEEEMVTIHVPIAILVLLRSGIYSLKWLDILEHLVNLVPQRAFSSIVEDFDVKNYTKDEIITSVTDYYNSLVNDESTEFPISSYALPSLILYSLEELYIENLDNPECSLRLCSLFCEILYTIPNDNKDVAWSNRPLVVKMLEQPVTNEATSQADKQKNLLIAFSLTKILNHISNGLSALEKAKLLKIILSNLWTSLVSPYPANYQVETVKCIFDLEISCPNYHITAGILRLLLQSPINERVRAFSTLWVHSNSFNDSNAVLARPLQLLLDDIQEEDNQNSMAVIDFIAYVFKSGSGNRLLKLLTSPLLDFEFMNVDRKELDFDDDLGQFSYHLNTILNLIRTNGKPVKDAFNTELAVMDNSAKLKIIKSNNWDISTYKSLMFYVIEKFFSLKLNKDIRNDPATVSNYYKNINTSLQLLSNLVTGNEPDFANKFHMLIDTCSYYTNLSDKKLYESELIENKFLKCILHFLKIAQDLKINLNLLHIEDEGKDPLLVRFIIKGIEKSQTSLLLESWMSLLTRSLYLFNESVFSVILTLNDAIIKKIDLYFKTITNYDHFDQLSDIEASISVLISGLEDLLSISHSYLLTSNMRANSDKINNNSDSGFFGNVIQGVFQLESPAFRTTEQNKLYSILLSFQDASKLSFLIWVWADRRPQINTGTVADKSLTYLAHKLKFKTRKFLETLVELERQEVIETLIKYENGSSSTIKLLHVLDGGRPQVTLPHIWNSIISRCHASVLEESQVSSLTTNISAKELSKFLVEYVETIDNDSISDIWNPTVQFFREVLSYSAQFSEVLSDFLKVIKTLSIKLNSSKFGEQRKNKKELADLFLKLLTASVSSKHKGFSIIEPSQNEEEEKINEDSTGTEAPHASQDELFDALSAILEYLDDIMQDSDKASSCINTIIANLVSPQIKPKHIHEIPVKTLALMELIGKYHPNKSWKSLISDSFTDNSFFNVSENRLNQWKPIISNWISSERDKISDLIVKITPSVLSTPSNIFVWNENSEVESKRYVIRRITFLIICQPNDYFLPNLDDLFGRITYSLDTLCPISYRTEITKLIRVLVLKFSELHLLPHWITINHELISTFEFLREKPVKELTTLTYEEVNFILSGCKLLDQLLLLKYDEFNLNEWLFVSTNVDVADSGPKTSILAIIDKTAAENEVPFSKEPTIKIEQPNEEMIPLLYGVKSIKSISSLRSFFDSLSLINYERTYNLYEVNIQVCIKDATNDLLA